MAGVANKKFVAFSGVDDESGNKNPVISFMTYALHKAQDAVPLKSDESLALERELEQLLRKDKEMDRRVRELVMALRPVPIEPDSALVVRATIRPFITKWLTIVFITFMMIWVFSSVIDQMVFAESIPETGGVAAGIKEMLPVFLGIYGSVIGFWFGEHSALKNQEKKN